MKRSTYNIPALVLLAASMWLTSCSDRNNTSDSDQTNNDTSLTDTRRNTTDTVNYLTKDSGNQSQDVIDMDAPTNSRY
jgi:uncharacterized lipoprotein YajG